MGANCCVPAKDDIPTVLREKYKIPHELYSHRNSRRSPSWAFRCDNRTHIEDIVDNPDGLSHHHSSTNDLEFKSGGDREIESLSDGSSSSQSFQPPKWLPGPNKLSIQGNSEAGTSGQSTWRYASPEEKVLNGTPIITSPADAECSSSIVSADPSSSGTSFLPFVGRTSTLESLDEEDGESVLSVCNDDLSPRGSNGGSSSEAWPYSELVVSPQVDDFLFSNRMNTQPSSTAFSSNTKTCGVCSKLLGERASWNGNEIAVIAVLACGHFYHAECLESTTPEASKFDPSCPTCFNGESSEPKVSTIASSKARNKVSGKAATDDAADGNFILERQKSGNYILRKMASSSSWKSSFARPFLRRYFSIGSRPESESSRKKGIWARYR